MIRKSSLPFAVSVAGALTLLAGGVSPVLAQAQPQVSVASQRGLSKLVFNGQTIHSTRGAIANQRAITFRGSPTVLIVWEEYSAQKMGSSHFALSKDGRRIDQIATTENKVRLRYATFDPLAGEPVIAGPLSAAEGNELYLVQFVATPLEEMRAEIGALGGSVLRFLTDNTHVVRMSAETRERVQALPYVRWVGAFHPAYRLEEGIRESLASDTQVPAARYSIECMRPGMLDQQALGDLITGLGGIVERYTPDQYRMEATLTPEQVLDVVAHNEVNFVEPWQGPGGHDMNLVRQTGGAVPLLSGLNFLGQGVRGEVHDTEVFATHQQWNGQTPMYHGTNGNSGTHGSSCYGINFATGTGNAQATGMLPMREQGIFYWYPNSTQFGGTQTRLAANTEATDPNGNFRSVFQTSSVGSTQITTYTTISAEVDDYLFRVDYLSCQSQSNTGDRNSRPQAWAKNIVSVGGLDLRETVTLADDIRAPASIGPAQDLRVKPDLSHSYGGIFTTTAGATAYTEFGGTSGATPITAGHFGLLHQMWHQSVWTGHGGGATVFASRPKSTTAKALMINGAFRYTATAANSMYRGYIGWGIADLAKIYNGRDKLFIVNWGDALTNGQTRTHNLLVAAGEPELRITMIYPDPMGNTAAAQQRINDLTLKVTDPNGIVYWGNNGMVPTAISGAGQLVGANLTTGGGAANTYDTVENVFLANPVPGTWAVEIIASQIVQDGYLTTPAMDAVYSLVASNVTLGPPPPTGACCLPSAPCTIMTQSNCLALNGTYHGDNSNCAQANCPPIGACCFADGTCQHMSGSACATAGGTYRGDNVNCNVGNCTGACCLADGTCLILGPSQCTAQQGVYAGGGVTCAAANCPQPGACCSNDGTCTITSSAICAAQGGLYRGNGSACASANCPQPPGMFTYSGAPVTIPDSPGTGCGTTAVAEIIVPTSFTVTGAQAGVFIDMNYQGDIRFRLVHGATSVYLANRPGTSLSTFGFSAVDYGLNATPAGSMKFNDGGASVYDAPPVPAPGIANPTGVWKPRTGLMANFVGSNAQGAWRLEAEDCAGGIAPGTIQYFNVILQGNEGCYANCDASTQTPILNVQDFTCFLQRYAAGESYANCDNSTQAPTLNVQDFTCFLQRYAAGCP
jgi:hypothetical protein